MLVLPVLGVAMVLGQTIGQVVTDPRLMARHLHARRLRKAAVSGISTDFLPGIGTGMA